MLCQERESGKKNSDTLFCYCQTRFFFVFSLKRNIFSFFCFVSFKKKISRFFSNPDRTPFSATFTGMNAYFAVIGTCQNVNCPFCSNDSPCSVNACNLTIFCDARCAEEEAKKRNEVQKGSARVFYCMGGHPTNLVLERHALQQKELKQALDMGPLLPGPHEQECKEGTDCTQTKLPTLQASTPQEASRHNNAVIFHQKSATDSELAQMQADLTSVRQHVRTIEHRLQILEGNVSQSVERRLQILEEPVLRLPQVQARQKPRISIPSSVDIRFETSFPPQATITLFSKNKRDLQFTWNEFQKQYCKEFTVVHPFTAEADVFGTYSVTVSLCGRLAEDLVYP